MVRVLASNWTWDDAKIAIDEQVAMVKSVEHGVHLIFDLGKTGNVPVDGTMRRLPKLVFNAAPNELLSFYIGAPVLLKRFLEILEKIYGLRQFTEKFHYVKDVDEALAIIDTYNREQNLTGEGKG